MQRFHVFTYFPQQGMTWDEWNQMIKEKNSTGSAAMEVLFFTDLIHECFHKHRFVFGSSFEKPSSS